MSEFTITVVGTGVIGTSIGLALKQKENTLRLIAHDKELNVAKAAVKAGAFDKAEWNLINACEQANLIVLATPLNSIRPTLEAIAPYISENTVITDVCRAKRAVVTAAQEYLPGHASFIGGDPIVYPSGSGYEHGTATLFQNRLYCLTPTATAGEEAIQLLVNFVNLLGGQPFFLDVDEHDGLVAAVEYLPALLSTALLHTLSKQQSWRESRKLAGRVFEQVSAGAEGDPDSLKDGLLSNRDTLLSWLEQYMSELAQLRTLLLETAPEEKDAGEALAQNLDKAIVQRRNWLIDYQENRFIDSELIPPEIETPSLLKRWMGFGR
jgi:prephenate dehydrogenase